MTGEVMDAGLSDEAVEVLERIVFDGYKGWTDISERLVRSFLDDLAALGACDRDLVLAYVRQKKYELSVERLVKIFDNYDATASAAAAAPRRWDL